MQKLNETIQIFGRSLLLPIAVLAPVGMVMGLSSALGQPYLTEKLPLLASPTLITILSSMKSISGTIFSNIPLLFAMGVAYGMSKKDKGIAIFAAVISYLTLLISMNVSLKLTGELAAKELIDISGQNVVLGIQTLSIDALGGIIAGLIGAYCTDRYSRLELPIALSFFAGKKSVAIITVFVSAFVGLAIPFFWSIFQAGMVAISGLLMNVYIGPAIFSMLNRLLIPFGLHHILDSAVRFTEAGGQYIIEGKTYIGVIPPMNELLFNLGPQHPAWAEHMPKISAYLAPNQMLTTLFRIPAMGLAMYHCAKPENRKFAKGAIITVVATAFLGNVTEPMEFSFMFISAPLFAIYSVLSGIGSIPQYFLDISMGYIRGTIFDFGIFGLMYEHTQWLNLVVLGLLNSVMFYFAFRWAIVKFDAKTIGREDGVSNSTLLEEKEYDKIAGIVVNALGGRSNIDLVENCITRLRIDIKDKTIVDTEALRNSGAAGIVFPNDNHIQIVYGPAVEFVRNAVDDNIAGISNSDLKVAQETV
ncbi:PTS trehalose transporter subunit IIC [Vibrio sp. 99-8-1]|nr:PTS trehalose transporter subunit IIC [Vibrio sp. 99-8-1]